MIEAQSKKIDNIFLNDLEYLFSLFSFKYSEQWYSQYDEMTPMPIETTEVKKKTN